MGLFRDAQRWSLKSVTHILQWWNMVQFTLSKEDSKHTWITWYTSWVLLTQAFFHWKLATFFILRNADTHYNVHLHKYIYIYINFGFHNDTFLIQNHISLLLKLYIHNARKYGCLSFHDFLNEISKIKHLKRRVAVNNWKNVKDLEKNGIE